MVSRLLLRLSELAMLSPVPFSKLQKGYEFARFLQPGSNSNLESSFPYSRDEIKLCGRDVRCDVNVLLLPIKVNPNYSDAISKAADQSHLAKSLKTDRKTYRHQEFFITPNKATAQE